MNKEAIYSFGYRIGSHERNSGVCAESDEKAYRKINEFLARVGGTLKSGSIKAEAHWKVPDPPVGLNWKISPETKRQIEAIDRHIVMSAVQFVSQKPPWI